MFRYCVQVVAVCSVGFVACSGGGDGGGSPSKPTPTVTRVIGLSGNLAFGNGEVGRTATATLTISNSGTGTLTVSGFTLPAGFTVNFQSGSIAAGGSQPVTVAFTPTAVGNYGGMLTVNADHTGGTNTIGVSGTGMPPTNRAPTITSITINPAFGVAQLSLYSMNATATDPENDALAFTWDFGDGTQGTGSSVTKMYNSGGVMTVRLTVSDGKAVQGIATATTSDTRSIDVASMTGTWTSVTGPAALGTYRFTLVQQGAVFTGTYWDSTYGDGRLDPGEPGHIDANGSVQWRVKQGAYEDWYFTGTMNGARSIAGTVRSSGFTGQPFSIQKQ